MPAERLGDLIEAIHACRLCRDAPIGRPLPHEPRPVLRVSPRARLAVCGQAPGTRVHASGVPFSDPSGARLRAWMGIDEACFYDAARIAIIPMGFCFPGQDEKGTDRPPRRECVRTWHDRLFAALPQIELVLMIGQYAQAYHLGAERRPTLTGTVADWRTIHARRRPGKPAMLPLPHPSWRNNAWLKRHGWFEAELLPVLRHEVARLTAPA